MSFLMLLLSRIQRISFLFISISISNLKLNCIKILLNLNTLALGVCVCTCMRVYCLNLTAPIQLSILVIELNVEQCTQKY